MKKPLTARQFRRERTFVEQTLEFASAPLRGRQARQPRPAGRVRSPFWDLARLRSDAKAREVAFRVAQPGCGARLEHTGEHLRYIGGEGKRRGRGVLFEAADVARAGNWYDKRLLRQQPGKR